MAREERHKIVIDTDCGIDDALAIMLALNSKDIAEILAITCCFGNTTLDNACENVKRVLTLCDSKDIPIYKGASTSLLNRDLPETVHGGDGLGGCAHLYSTGGILEENMPAALALTTMAKNNPEEITLIAIGPLTNLAMAHRLDPEFTKNLKSIVIMGGNYKGIGNTTEVAEFNFYCDPEAANIILTEAECHITLVPWETTMDYGIKWDFFFDLLDLCTDKSLFFQRIVNLPVRRALDKNRTQLYDCDFLAVAALLYPQSITLDLKCCLAVECDGTHTDGLTILLDDKPDIADERRSTVIFKFDLEFLNALFKKMLEN